jgi:hypothetical protein
MDPHLFELLDPVLDSKGQKLPTKREKVKKKSYFKVLDVLF